jgi:hypothetical protein
MEKENKRLENNHRHRRGFPTPPENRPPAGLKVPPIGRVDVI